MLMYRNRYRLGAIFNEKSGELNIKQVSPKSHYKDIYRKMSGELRRFAGEMQKYNGSIICQEGSSSELLLFHCNRKIKGIN